MKYIKKFCESDLKFEYGLDAVRTFPWSGITPPFGGGYCIVHPETDTLPHINSPNDEDEMFIAIQGTAYIVLNEIEHEISKGDIVMIPRGIHHFVRNKGKEAFHFYTIWWNDSEINNYLNAERKF